MTIEPVREVCGEIFKLEAWPYVLQCERLKWHGGMHWCQGESHATGVPHRFEIEWEPFAAIGISTEE
jgi:hypothetical protein